MCSTPAGAPLLVSTDYGHGGTQLLRPTYVPTDVCVQMCPHLGPLRLCKRKGEGEPQVDLTRFEQVLDQVRYLGGMLVCRRKLFAAQNPPRWRIRNRSANHVPNLPVEIGVAERPCREPLTGTGTVPCHDHSQLPEIDPLLSCDVDKHEVMERDSSFHL